MAFCEESDQGWVVCTQPTGTEQTQQKPLAMNTVHFKTRDKNSKGTIALLFFLDRLGILNKLKTSLAWKVDGFKNSKCLSWPMYC